MPRQPLAVASGFGAYASGAFDLDTAASDLAFVLDLEPFDFVAFDLGPFDHASELELFGLGASGHVASEI